MTRPRFSFKGAVGVAVPSTQGYNSLRGQGTTRLLPPHNSWILMTHAACRQGYHAARSPAYLFRGSGTCLMPGGHIAPRSSIVPECPVRGVPARDLLLLDLDHPRCMPTRIFCRSVSRL